MSFCPQCFVCEFHQSINGPILFPIQIQTAFHYHRCKHGAKFASNDIVSDKFGGKSDSYSVFLQYNTLEMGSNYSTVPNGAKSKVKRNVKNFQPLQMKYLQCVGVWDKILSSDPPLKLFMMLMLIVVLMLTCGSVK